jgi:hypothetical protein
VKSTLLSLPDQTELTNKIDAIKTSLAAMEAGHSEKMDIEKTVLDVEDSLREYLEQRKLLTSDQRNTTAAALRSIRLASLWGKISGVIVRSTLDDASALEREARLEQVAMMEERAESTRTTVEWHRELFLRLQQVQLEKTLENPRGSLIASSTSLPSLPSKAPPKEFGAIPSGVLRQSTIVPKSAKQQQERTAILEGIDSLVGALRASRAVATRENKLRLEAEARCAALEANMEGGKVGSDDEEVRRLEAELAATNERCDRVTEAFTRLSAVNVAAPPPIAPSSATTQPETGQSARINELIAEVESLKTAKKTLERHIMALSADNQRMAKDLVQAQKSLTTESESKSTSLDSNQRNNEGEEERKDNRGESKQNQDTTKTDPDSTEESTDFTKYLESFLF